jgi:hypothetical protein
MRGNSSLFGTLTVLCLGALAGCSSDVVNGGATGGGRYQVSGEPPRLLDITTGDVYDVTWTGHTGNGTWVKRITWPGASGSATAAPAPPSSRETAAPEPPQDLRNGQYTIGLDQNLHALKAARDEGTLTSAEYARARSKAVDGFEKFLAQRTFQSLGALQLHDELAGLKRLNKNGDLTDDEYQRARDAFVAAYLPNEH